MVLIIKTSLSLPPVYLFYQADPDKCLCFTGIEERTESAIPTRLSLFHFYSSSRLPVADCLVLGDERKSNNVSGVFFCFSLWIAVIQFYKVPREYPYYIVCNIYGYVYVTRIFAYCRDSRKKDNARCSFNFLSRKLLETLYQVALDSFLTKLWNLILSANVF